MEEAERGRVELVRAAAMSGVPEAQAMFGQMLLDGRLVERNAAWALHWFELAAKGGDLMAVNMVGRCFDQGWGVARSTVLAERWFRKAAERGLDWGMYNLATVLTLGEGGVRQDRMEALYWLQRAVELKHAKSINILGGFYEDGWIVEQDVVRAAKLYRESATLGDFRGQFNYARLLALAGRFDEAAEWMRRVPETATPAFLAKAQLFLANQVEERFRWLGSVLCREGSEESSRC
jgi:TPR repeat protein